MPVVGDVLAERYRIDGVLGAGGMASVYRATDLRLERSVAVKVLLPNLAQDPSLAARFDREARMLAALAHPNVAAIFDVDLGDPATGREPYYVMELCEGGSLAARIDANGRLAPGELVPIIVAVAGGLAELHRQGLVHRDVKPGNVLFTGGRPKLADFGLAKGDSRPEFVALTEPGTAVGTPGYMAPELVSGGAATTASDVFALAATTFHGLAGRAPRAAESPSGLVATQVEPVPSVSELAPDVGLAFDAPLAAALAADPASRPSLNAFTASLVAALSRSAESRGSPAVLAGPAIVADDPLDETTRMAAVSAPTRMAPTQRSPRARERASAGRRGYPMWLGGLLAVVLLAAALAALLAPSGQAPTSPAPSATATSSPGPSPTPAATPSPVVSPTADARARLLRSIDEVSAAIEQARGGPEGLGGGDARELLDLAEAVRREILDGDDAAARAAAERLSEQADDLLDDVDDDRAEIVEDAIDNLLAMLPG